MTTTGDARAEIISIHRAHPSSHNLVRVTTDDQPFKCDGCKEPGSKATARYMCDNELCSFKQLHECCAIAPATVNHHQFGNSTFEFHVDHPDTTPGSGRFCDVCRKATLGFVYHCPKKNAVMHPCCALRLQGACLCTIDGTAKRRRQPYSKHRKPFSKKAV